jgi:hypothetical protein
VVALELERLKNPTSLSVRQAQRRLAPGVEYVERDEHDWDVVVAVEHPLAEPGEAWFAVVTERDQLPV